MNFGFSVLCVISKQVSTFKNPKGSLQCVRPDHLFTEICLSLTPTRKEVLLTPLYMGGNWESEMLACLRPRWKWSKKLGFKSTSGCASPPSASSNWILALLMKQKSPSEMLALQPEWSFKMLMWFRRPQSPPPAKAFQWLPIALRPKESLTGPEALWKWPPSYRPC